jgi:hypothetical protein
MRRRLGTSLVKTPFVLDSVSRPAVPQQQQQHHHQQQLLPVQGDQHQEQPARPTPQPLVAAASIKVLNLDELHLACDHMHKQWWQQWGSEAASGGGQHRQYACLFKQWRHLDANEQ